MAKEKQIEVDAIFGFGCPSPVFQSEYGVDSATIIYLLTEAVCAES
jgi:hypothetical protein